MFNCNPVVSTRIEVFNADEEIADEIEVAFLNYKRQVHSILDKWLKEDGTRASFSSRFTIADDVNFYKEED